MKIIETIQTKYAELYAEYKLIFWSFIIGLGVGILITIIILFNARPDVPKTKPVATVENKSGAPLRVDNIKTDKDKIIIDTSYDGVGKSQIGIPSQAIPSGFMWDNYRWSACGGYMSNQTLLIGAGYRYERLTIMGGGFVKVGSQPEAGVWCMASWSFKSWW